MNTDVYQGPIALPAALELGPLLGQGRRSRVYRAEYLGRAVAVKVYRREAVEKYQRRCGLSIARFEHDRNAAFCRVAGLRELVAEPVGVLGEGDGYAVAFLQELIEGSTLSEVVRAEGGIPGETLWALRRLVELAGAAGLYDIDLSPSNMKVRREAAGWMPVLFDFNMIPQHQRAPNPFVGMMYRVGLRHPAHRDRLMLRKLQTWRG